MKKIVASILILFLCCATMGCGNDLIIDGRNYGTKGIFSSSEKDPCIQYRTIVGNVFWGIILAETLFAPIYFFGFSLWEPVRKKPECIRKN